CRAACWQEVHAGDGLVAGPRGGCEPGGRGSPRDQPANPVRRGSTAQPARQIALDILIAVRNSDAYANLLLPVRLERARLSEADAGLATELTYGTLRLSGYYDRVIELAARRPTAEIDPA